MSGEGVAVGTGSTESVERYVEWRLPDVAAVMGFLWLTRAWLLYCSMPEPPLTSTDSNLHSCATSHGRLTTHNIIHYMHCFATLAFHPHAPPTVDRNINAVAVTDEDGTLLKDFSAANLRKISLIIPSSYKKLFEPVGDLMVHAEDIPTAPASATLSQILEGLSKSGVYRIWIVNRYDIMFFLSFFFFFFFLLWCGVVGLIGCGALGCCVTGLPIFFRLSVVVLLCCGWAVCEGVLPSSAPCVRV
jgi:hypothetical protein